ncbi:MAG: ABC-type lipoprotein release transport system permease subunit [Myxococcota bacterium]|jgi:ABC-type lipoprotein release transport system permease subunit
MIWIAIAWRNLTRQGRRTLVTASAMSVSVALCMASICLIDGMYDNMFDLMVNQQLGHIQVHHVDYPAKRSMYDTIAHADEVLQTIDAMPGVQGVTPRLMGFGLLGGATRSAGARLVGIDPVRESAVTPIAERIKAGTYLDAAESGGILLGRKLAEELELGVGDEVIAVTQAADGSTGNVLYTVKGLFHTGDIGMDKGGAYLLLSDLQELMVLPDQVHQLTLTSTDREALDTLAAAISAAEPDLLVRTWSQVSPSTAQMMSMQTATAGMLLGIVFLVASFGVVNTMLVSVFERTTEFGVMRALGVAPRQLVTMVVVEAILLGAIAAVGGVTVGLGLDAYLVITGLDFSASIGEGFEVNGVMMDPVLRGAFNIEPVLSTVLILIAVSGLAAVWPAARAAMIRPVDAIRAD